MSTEAIREALAKLDTSNENQWTGEGLPRIDTIKFLAGGMTVTREDISRAAPNFTRENPTLETTTAAAAAPLATATDTGTGASEQTAPAGVAAALPADTSTQGEHNGDAEGPYLEEIDSSAPLEKQLALAQERLAQLQQAKVRFDAIYAEAVQQHDAIADAIHERDNAESSGSAVRDYLDSQMRERDAKAAKMRAIAESGLDIKMIRELVPQASLLDQKLGSRKR